MNSERQFTYNLVIVDFKFVINTKLKP